jgi:hypothetical protein
MPSGSILQLVAIGLDTVYLTGEPQITLFKMVYRRHTNFTIVPQNEIIQDVKKLDLETNFTLLKKGDCISNLHLVLNIGDFKVKYLDPTNLNVKNTLKKFFIDWITLYQPTQIITKDIYDANKKGTGKIYDQVYNYVEQNNNFLRFINDVTYGINNYKNYNGLISPNQRKINRIYNDTSFDISKNLISLQLDNIVEYFTNDQYLELYEYISQNIIVGNINGIYPSDILTNLNQIYSYIISNKSNIQFVDNFIRYIYDYGYGIFYLNPDYSYHSDGLDNRVLKFYELDSSGNYILDSSGNKIPKPSNLSTNTILSSRIFDIIKSYELDVDISGINLVTPYLIRDKMFDAYLYAICDASSNILDASSNQDAKDMSALFILLNDINPSSATTFLAKKVNDYYTSELDYYYSNINYSNLNSQQNNYQTFDSYIMIFRYLNSLSASSNEIINDETLRAVKDNIINNVSINISTNYSIFTNLMNILKQSYFNVNSHYRIPLYKSFTNYVQTTPIDYTNVQSDFQTLNVLLPNTLSLNDYLFDQLIINDYTNNFFRTDINNYINTLPSTFNSGIQNSIISDYLNQYTLWAPYTIDNQKALLQQIDISGAGASSTPLNLYSILTDASLNYFTLNENAQKRLIIMNYLPLFLINEIPLAINTNLNSYVDGIGLSSIIPLDLSSNTITFKTDLYEKITRNIILPTIEPAASYIGDYDLINTFANKYVSNTNNFALYFLMRPEKGFEISGNIADGNTYFIPNIRGVVETFRHKYFDIIKTLTSESPESRLKAFELINIVLDSFIYFDCDQAFQSVTVYGASIYIPISAYDLYVKNYTYTAFPSQSYSYTFVYPIIDNRITKYMYAQSSVYNFLHLKSVNFINRLYNDITLNETYYETKLGITMNDLLTIFNNELTTKISTSPSNYFTGSSVTTFDQSGNLYPRIDCSYNLLDISGSGNYDFYIYNQTGMNITIPVQSIGYDFNDFQNAYNLSDFEHLIDGSGVDIVGMLKYTTAMELIFQDNINNYYNHKDLLKINNLYQTDISYNLVSDVVDYYNKAIESPDSYMTNIMNSVKTSITSIYKFFGDCIYGVDVIGVGNLVNWSVKDLLTSMTIGSNPFNDNITPNLWDCYQYHHSQSSQILAYFSQDDLIDKIYRSELFTTLYNNFAKKSDVLKFIYNYYISKSDGAYLLNYSTQNLKELIDYINSYLTKNKTNYYDIVSNILYNNNLPIPATTEIDYSNQNYSFYYSILEYSQTRMTYENSPCDKIITSMILNLDAEYSWVNEPGLYLFEKIQLLFNGDVFDSYNSNLLSLKTKLFTESNKLRGYNKLIQNTKNMITYNNLDKSNKEFVLPLDFYFSREITNSLPMTNILYTDVTLNFKTRKLEDLLIIADGAFIKKQPKIHCKIIVDYVYLEMEERLRIAASKIEFLADRYKYGRIFTYKYSNIVNGRIREKLYFADPTKFILWRVKSKNSDKQNWNYNDYYKTIKTTKTYSLNNYPPYSLYQLNIIHKEIVKNIKFYFNGNVRQEGSYRYFNSVIPYECNLGALNSGEFLYSFSFLPKLLQPSGAANLSMIQDIEIEQELNPEYLELMKNENLEIEVEYFSYSYQILRIMSGFAAPAFINTK